MKKTSLAKTGFVLLSVVCISLIFIVIIIPLISWSANEFSWTVRSFMSLRALNLADAGAESAIWEIMYNNANFDGWSGINPKTSTLYSFTDNLGEAVGDISISADNTSPGHYLVTSVGFIPSLSSFTVKKTVKVKVFPHALFNNAVFGYSSVSMSGNVIVDSYDSSLGPYSPLNMGSNADIGTNGIFTRSENATVKGDIFVGPDGEATGNTPPYVTGDTYYYGNEVEPIDVPFDQSYFTTLPSLGNLMVGGKDGETIASGDYRYEGITVTGQATLTLSNNTRIYIHNDFSVGGQATVFTGDNVVIYIGGDGDFAGQGIVNITGMPSNLQVYGLNSSTSLSFTGLNDFYGVIYAQDSSVYLGGNADYFGSVAGKDVTLAGNTSVHYDEALATNGPFSGYDIAYWQED